MNKDTFCPMPWIGASIENTGTAKVCCAYDCTADQDYQTRMGKLEDFSAWRKIQLEPLRQDLLNGVRAPGCHRCWSTEDAGTDVQSDREIMNDFVNLFGSVDLDTVDQIQHLSIAFGNTCNLRCIMCGPYSSSNWVTEIQQNFNILSEYKPPVTNDTFLYYKSDAFKEIEAQLIQHVKYVALLGGEPLFSPEALSFLEKLPASMRLRVVTNGTNLKDSTYELLSKFENVALGISVDGVGIHGEYVRYGTEWSQLEQNIQRLRALPNVKTFDLFYILQHYSYHTLIPMLQFCIDNLYPIRIQTVAWENYLSMNTLTENQRIDLLDQLDQFWDKVMLRPLNQFVQSSNTVLLSDRAIECLQSVRDAVDYTKSVLNTQYEHDTALKSRLVEFTNDIDSIRKINYTQAFGQKIHE